MTSRLIMGHHGYIIEDPDRAADRRRAIGWFLSDRWTEFLGLLNCVALVAAGLAGGWIGLAGIPAFIGAMSAESDRLASTSFFGTLFHPYALGIALPVLLASLFVAYFLSPGGYRQRPRKEYVPETPENWAEARRNAELKICAIAFSPRERQRAAALRIGRSIAEADAIYDKHIAPYYTEDGQLRPGVVRRRKFAS
jgi:hypothetical protein